MIKSRLDTPDSQDTICANGIPQQTNRRLCMAETLNEVKAVISEVMKIDDDNINLDTRFIEDLKADSMDQFFLIDGFCEKFGVNISDDDARSIKTVSDVVTYVDTHKN
jgi:acyl carrier protein